MTQWALQSDLPYIHDPALGLGVFYQAALQQSPAASFSAHETDTTILASWDPTTLSSLSSLTVASFLTDPNPVPEPANVVCNPPYMRYQSFPDREASLAALRTHHNVHLDAKTNAAAAFLAKAVAIIQPPARLCFLMPLEFLDTSYGVAVKQLLIQCRHLAAIISITCEHEVFPDVITTTGIILYDSNQTHDVVNFYQLSSINQLNLSQLPPPNASVPCESLDPTRKWLQLTGTSNHIPELNQRGTHTTIADYGNVVRGIATGAKPYFVLRPSQLEHLNIPHRDVHPCIPSSKTIAGPIFQETDFDNLVSQDQPVYLFTPRRPPAAPSAAYIASGVDQKIHERHLTRHRSPWYAQDRRPPAPILLSTFFRGAPKIVLNTTTAFHLNCFHGYYPLLPYLHLTTRLFVYLHSRTALAAFAANQRTYGNQLLKFEPSDIGSIIAPTLPTLESMTDSSVNKAIDLISRRMPIPDTIESLFAKSTS